MKDDIEAHQEASRIDSNIETVNEKLVDYKDVDAALSFLRANANVETSNIDEKKLMRKVDWMIMPLMFACYYLQYTDKTLCEWRIRCIEAIADVCECRTRASWALLKTLICRTMASAI
jgi:hypothetical protein